MSKQDRIREVQFMLDRLGIHGGFQVAKDIVNLASTEPGTFKKIGPRKAGMRRPMSQAEAARILKTADERIALADAED